MEIIKCPKCKCDVEINIANAKDEEEPSGVDDVLDEITERSKDR